MAKAQKKIRGKVIVSFWSCIVNDLNCAWKNVILWKEIAASNSLECTVSVVYILSLGYQKWRIFMETELFVRDLKDPLVPNTLSFF